jgi:hypothetical protein
VRTRPTDLYVILLFLFFSSVLTIQRAYMGASLGSITLTTDGYLSLLFLSGSLLLLLSLY